MSEGFGLPVEAAELDGLLDRNKKGWLGGVQPALVKITRVGGGVSVSTGSVRKMVCH